MRAMLLVFLALVSSSAFARLPGSVTRIGGVGICAKDPVAMKAWYEKFGFAMKKGPALESFEATIVGSRGEATHIGLWPAGKMGAFCANPTNGGVGINFAVDDFDAFSARLRAAGLEPILVQQESVGRFAYYEDPEGTVVSIWGK